MTAATANGGEELARACAVERAEEGEEHGERMGTRESERESRGQYGVVQGGQTGREEVETSVARAPTCLCLLAEVEDDRFGQWARPVGWAANWAGQVGCAGEAR